MTTALADTYAAVAARVSYIRAGTVPLDEDDWISCADLRDDPHLLGDLIRTTGVGRGTDDQAVAASLFLQGYAFRVPSVALAAFALGLPSPNVSAELTAFRVTRHRPAEVAYLSPSVSDDLVDAWHDHLAGLIAIIRTIVKVGERLLWGNAAASAAVAFRAVDGALQGVDEKARVRAQAAEFFAASPHLAGLGAFEIVTVGNQSGWFWTRTSCCLWYQVAPSEAAGTPPMCDDCSLISKDDLHAARVRQLEGTPA